MIDFQALSKGQKTSLIAFIALILALAGYLVYWLLNPQYVLIYQDQKLAQVSSVTSQLELDGIDYRLEDNGSAVWVPESYANKTKVKLAQVNAGDGQSVGFELFDTVDYSMTEQAQKVTYQRALQGELARTISAFQEVAQARVHIMLPEARLFSADKGQPRASVSLTLEPGVTLSSEQVTGIQGVVATAVDGLTESGVIVLNGEGLKISANEETNTPGATPPKNQLMLEQQLSEKAQHILRLYFDPAKVAVSVSVELDNSQIKEVEQLLLTNKDDQGFISRKKETFSYQKDAGKDSASGDNPPPANVIAKGRQRDSQSEIEYQHGSQTRETLNFAGGIKRLNVAIAIVADIDDDRLAKIYNLISAGLGIEPLRGDQLSVESMLLTDVARTAATLPVNALPVNALPATPAPATPVLAPQASGTSSQQAEPSGWAWLLGALAVLLLVGLFGLVVKQPKGLNTVEKQALLGQFDDWLKQPQSDSHAS